MSGHRPFRELEEKMRPEARAKVDGAGARETQAKMLLVDVQKLTGREEKDFAVRLSASSPRQFV